MKLIALLITLVIYTVNVSAQTTAFTYQGRLNDTSIAANGGYDFQFSLFSAVTGGAQQGTMQTVTGVAVASGVFTVQLDFGASPFAAGADRYLEIRVKQAAQPSYTLLAPRQRITAASYASRALSAAAADTATTAATATNAQNLNGQPSGNYVQTNDTRLTDARSPTAGNGFYIQNQTAGTQTADFSISGTGAANIINAATQFNLGGSRVLSVAGSNNIFTGINAGSANTTGFNNSFFGRNAGSSNSTGSDNTLIGNGANVGSGALTFATALGSGTSVTASNTVVLGRTADTVQVPGNLNLTGIFTGNLSAANITSGTLSNARLGVVGTANGGTGLSVTGASGNYLRSNGTVWNSSTIFAGDLPDLGASYIRNSGVQQSSSNFYISEEGRANTFKANSFFSENGYYIGSNRVLSGGTSNILVGYGAGAANAGSQNSFFGYNSGFVNTSGSDNSFIGVDAGRLNTTASDNSFFGVSAGLRNTTGNGNVFLGRNAGETNATGFNNTIVGKAANVASDNLSFATAIGSGAVVNSSSTVVLGRNSDTVQVPGNLNVSGTLSGSFSVSAANVTGVLGTANGGTGLNSAGAAGSYLRSNGTVWLGSTIPAADVPNLDAGKITTGTFNIARIPNIDDARLSSNVATLSGTQTFTGAKTFSGGLSGTISGNGSGLTNLNASNIVGGVVGTANGGTGLGATGAAGNFLRSNGTTWTTAIIQVSDVQNLSSSVIQNTGVQQAASNFNISGEGKANMLTADSLNATTQFNIGLSKDRVLSASGISNIFTGVGAGAVNSGISNSFFGRDAGLMNTTGSANSFFGASSGRVSTGADNSFFGADAGGNNTTGSSNVFLGKNAGQTNTTGFNNTLIGKVANVSSDNLSFATAIGSGAVVSTSNTIVLGRTSDTVLVPNFLQVNALGAAGSIPLCRNVNNQISDCSSSLRYKTNLVPFHLGLSFINQLRPISFDWKDGGMHDVGFGAEEVAAINPLFVNYNQAGEVEGVKYDRLSVTFVNAFREQQTQIKQQEEKSKQQQEQMTEQQARIERQQREINELKTIVCSLKPDAAICKKINK